MSTDDLFAILSNRRRRFTISYLQDATFPIEVGELAMAIAAIENDQSVDALSSQQRKRVYVALYQNHLPKLDAANVVSYHKSRGVVERGPNLDVVVEYLNRVGGLQETIAEPQTAEVSSAPHGRFGVASGLLMVALAVGFVGPVPAPLVLVAVGAAVVLVAGYLLATGDHLETPR